MSDQGMRLKQRVMQDGQDLRDTTVASSVTGQGRAHLVSGFFLAKWVAIRGSEEDNRMSRFNWLGFN